MKEKEPHYTRVKKDLIWPPCISTLGLELTEEGKNSCPLQTCLVRYVTAILILGVKESRTSPMTLSTTRGSGILAIGGGGNGEKGNLEMREDSLGVCCWTWNQKSHIYSTSEVSCKSI